MTYYNAAKELDCRLPQLCYKNGMKLAAENTTKRIDKHYMFQSLASKFLPKCSYFDAHQTTKVFNNFKGPEIFLKLCWIFSH